MGLGALFRILKRPLRKTLEQTGSLPTRYYLRRILESLDRDNIGEAVRLLSVSRGALVDRSRRELVRQQVLFRCRVLMKRHDRRIRSIEGRIETLNRGGRFPWRWFRKIPAERLVRYENLLSLEKQAQSLLEKYERELRNI